MERATQQPLPFQEHNLAGRMKILAAGLALLALTACDSAPPPAQGLETSPRPPANPALAQVTQTNAQPSEASRALNTYYTRLQNDLLVQGLLRTDGGGPDTPYTADMLARNFEQIAFYDEYARGGGLSAGAGLPGKLKRWATPVRMSIEFGPSVSSSQQANDRAALARYSARLARSTRHPISVSPTGGNFNILIMSQDDNAVVRSRVQALVPGIDPAALRLFTNLPRTIHCLVVAFTESPSSSTYTKAVALIRAEHPELMRRSCIHEELAQGLGLANDSPAARPSIFNDDDEFALLTAHDADLLGMLYDPRLQIGMTLSAARPIITQIARERVRGGS